MLKEGVPQLTEQEELAKDYMFLKEYVQKLTQENQILKEELRKQNNIVDMLQKALFGPRTEKTRFIDPDQLLLFDEKQTEKEIEEQPEEKITVPEHTCNKRKARGAGRELPVVIEIIDLPDEEKIGPDGKPKIQFDYVDTDKIEHTPEKLFILRLRRLKYKNASDSDNTENSVFSIPALPPQIAPKSIFTPSLLAYLAVTKFLDGLPFNRIEKRFKRNGYQLLKATMVNGLLNAAKRCEVLVELLLEELKKGAFIQMDETTFQVHKEHGRNNKTKSWIWVMRGGPPDKPIILFKYHTGRDKKVPLLYLSEYKGFIQTDGYDGYIDIGKLPGIIHALCWAHARRYFVKAFEQSQKKDNLASEAITLIGKLFSIEKRLRKEKLKPEEFLTRRRKEAEPVFESIKAWLFENENKVAPKSLLGQAIGYTLKYWNKLIKYIECPYLTPSTNSIENVIRTVVIGRKNYLFFGSPRGAYAGMTIYTLIETAKANGLEPYKYLKYIFEKIPYCKNALDYKNLLPQYLNPLAFKKFE